MDTEKTKPGVLSLRPRSSFTPSTDVWFTDGSVVLVAESTGFRVHASILATACEVFKDMFAMPQPEDADEDVEKYEGCQVIPLQDSPIELKHFLKAIYEFRYFRQNIRNKFPVVAAVLRLSTKYDASELRQCAVELISTAYPSTLSAWDQRSTLRLVPPFEGELGACLALAIQCDVRSILPALYYFGSRQPLSKILVEFRDLSLSPSAQWDACTDFLLGCQRLEEAELKNILAFLDPSFTRPDCQNNHDTDLLNVLSKQVARKATATEPYHQWCSAHPSGVGNSLGLCDRCRETVRVSIEEGRQKVWDQLPSLFGLADWGTLRARDDLQED